MERKTKRQNCLLTRQTDTMYEVVIFPWKKYPKKRTLRWFIYFSPILVTMCVCVWGGGEKLWVDTIISFLMWFLFCLLWKWYNISETIQITLSFEIGVYFFCVSFIIRKWNMTIKSHDTFTVQYVCFHCMLFVVFFFKILWYFCKLDYIVITNE